LKKNDSWIFGVVIFRKTMPNEFGCGQAIEQGIIPDNQPTLTWAFCQGDQNDESE
jgi:hypothetical protein